MADLHRVTPVALGVTLSALLPPDGHLRSRHWRLVAAASAGGIVPIVMGGSVAPEPLQGLLVDNPLRAQAGDCCAAGRVAVAVLRYRLWSDRLVDRTVTDAQPAPLGRSKATRFDGTDPA